MSIKSIFTKDQPRGSNNLGARSGFVQRISYEAEFEMFLKKFELSSVDFFDCRNTFINYGKYDKHNNVINLIESNLKFANQKSEKLALNFVIDAYESLKEKCKSAGELGTIKEEIFKNLEIKKSYSNIHQKYHDHMTLMFDKYIKFSEIQYKNKKIVDFKSFLNNFIFFISFVGNKAPILKSSFISSRDTSILDTGLAIELDSISKDNDNEKYKKYFQNFEFVIFQDLAKSNGFAIDKDCPWRLIFDINSENSIKFMKNYNLTSENIFDLNFFKTEMYDIENLKNYLVIFYNTLVQEENIVSVPLILNQNNINLVTSKLIERKSTTVQEIDSLFSPEYWFKLLSYIKLLENDVDMTQSEYNNLNNELINIFKKQNYEVALSYLNNFIKNSETSTVKKYFFV